MRSSSLGSAILAAAFALLCTTASPAWGQFGALADRPDNGLFAGADDSSNVVQVSAQFSTATADKPAYLFVTATIQEGWHIYSITQPPGGPVRTKIKVDSSPQYRLLGEFQATAPPEKKQEPAFDNLLVESHHGTITWYAPIDFSPGSNPQALTIQGAVTAQPCDANSCLPPREYPFKAVLGPGFSVPQASLPEARAIAPALDFRDLATKLGFAFLGGLILNLMPCVLPVISLKILSFVDQAGKNRAHTFALNLWYSFGLLSVFMVLAALAAVAGLAWGEQFTLPWFKVAMTALVFVMALSFLGVWEIPIPGFVGRGSVAQWQAQEGASGAFFKGVFTTILATPCSGPFLGPVFGFLLDQPPYMAYWIFGAVGLGMASPYLVIGAFPELLRFLPKPGQWMDVLRQLMGFLLLGTVVYLFSTMTAIYYLPTMTLLVGLWFACWWIGRTPITASVSARVFAWTGSLVVAVLIGLLAFTFLLHESKIPWQPFSPAALTQAQAEGKTVLVDFTADWCLTCKANVKFAIDTPRVRDLMDQNRVVPLLADWTDKSPVIKDVLNRLGYNSIPVLAIWPANSIDGKPIILTDLLTEAQVLAALQEAGPSKPSPQQALPASAQARRQ